MSKYKLIKPIDFEGEKVSEIEFDLNALTGGDILSAERQFLDANNANQYIMVKETVKEFQAYVLARAAKRPAELFFALGAQDFTQLTMRVNNFFIEGDLAVMEQASDNSSEK